MSVEIWEGAVAPEAYALALTSASVGGVDLSTVTGAVFVVKTPGGDEVQWVASTSYNAGTSTLTATHTFASGTSDVLGPGTWTLYARLTVPGGFVRSQPRTITVHSKFFTS